MLDVEIAGTPRPRNLSPAGCGMFLLAVGLFFGLSILTRRWALPWLVRSLIFGVIVIGLIGGLGLVFLGGRSGQALARAAALDALEQLTRQQSLAASVRLLWNAHYSGGPWVVTTIDVGSARERLEQAGSLAFVQNVERFLMSEHRIHTAFTVEGASQA